MRTSDLNDRDGKKILRLGVEYILKEILMTIESVGIDDLKIYQDISFSLIKSDLRPSVWNIYEKWQKLLKKSGYITIEQLRREALDRVTKRREKNMMQLLLMKHKIYRELHSSYYLD